MFAAPPRGVSVGGLNSGIPGPFTALDVWNPDKEAAVDGGIARTYGGVVGLHDPRELAGFLLPVLLLIAAMWMLEHRRIRIRAGLAAGGGVG